MEQTYQAVLCGDLLHDLHRDLVVIRRHIGFRIDRRQFMLRGCHFVVFRFCKHAQLPEFLVQFFHKSCHIGLDYAEIMIIHFLPLRRLCAEKRSSGETQIRAFIIHFLRYEEIFLFRADERDHTLCGIISEEPQDPERLHIQRLHGTQQRCFLIQCMAFIGTERSRDTQGLPFNERIGCGVPGGIASGLERRS